MLTTALEERLQEKDTRGAENTLSEDCRVDPHPFYFAPSAIAGVLHCSAPKEDLVRGALRHLGYQVTRSHCKPATLKTDAPWSTILWIMREWIRQAAPLKEDKIKPNSVAGKMLKLIRSEGASNGEDSGDNSTRDKGDEDMEESRRKTLRFDKGLEQLGRQEAGPRLVRYQQNPRENWGPMSKAKQGPLGS
jgi:tRNA (guanine26-N2/guanine27-N2)-dimethyltransferase